MALLGLVSAASPAAAAAAEDDVLRLTAAAEASEAKATVAAAAGLQALQHDKEVLETQLEEVSNECGRLQVWSVGEGLEVKVSPEFDRPQAAHSSATGPTSSMENS